EALGQDFHSRGVREAEQVRLLRKLWSDERVTFEGRFDTVTLASINPRPLRSIPIWFGGRSEAVLKRMARLGDGWIALGAPDEKLRADVDKVHAEMAKVGRNPDDFGLEGSINVTSGEPEGWAKQVEAWRAFGASHLTVRTFPQISAPRDGVTVEDHIALLKRF